MSFLRNLVSTIPRFTRVGPPALQRCLRTPPFVFQRSVLPSKFYHHGSPGAHSRIAVVGTGNVGASIAFALVLKDVANEILLVDSDRSLAKGQRLDLDDASLFSATHVKDVTLQEAGKADVIVVTAGARQKENESRADLIDRNYQVLESIINAMQPIQKDAIMILVANPVDVLTYFAQELSGLPRNQVIGSGTFLDTSRLRGFLSEVLEVNHESIHSPVLGEHGDAQFISWNTANIAGQPILSFPRVANLDKELVREKIAGKAMEIIKLKGSTYFGIATCTASLCETIIKNRRDIRPLSVYVDRLGAVMSMPAKLGWYGVEEIYEINDPVEEEKLVEIAQQFKKTCKKYEQPNRA
ncbi:lactate dehydrogenase B [Phycomyces nitens]|nr:lactate dehydrogenase B [Phycomyces nitens]